MPNRYINRAIAAIWSEEAGRVRRVLDLSVGEGDTSRILSGKGFEVVATEYLAPPVLGPSILRLGGVNLNDPLPFKDNTFDGVNLVEVIEHVEHQPQLIREIGRVLKAGGVVVISTPNVLNMFSRLRFLFTGFLRGRIRPLHYQHKPGIAHNIYLIHFYELYYLLFHYGFDIAQLRKTRVKLTSPLFAVFFYPFMWLFSLFSIIFPEKDPVQRRINWQILRSFLKSPLLFSDNIVVKARKHGREVALDPAPEKWRAGRGGSLISDKTMGLRQSMDRESQGRTGLVFGV
jgi:SAM-dependent methyltransferase